MDRENLRVVLIEDSRAQANLVSEVVIGWCPTAEVTVCTTLADGKAELSRFPVELVIADLELPDGQALELLPTSPDEVSYPLVILTSKGNEQVAVEAIKRGALEYQVKSSAALRNLPEIFERALRQWGHILARRKSEAALRDSEERFRTVFHSSATPMLLISPRGLLQQVNKAACLFFGYSESELLGRSLHDLTSSEDRPESWELLDHLKRGDAQELMYEHRYVHSKGKLLWAQLAISCVRNYEGKPLYLIGQLVDTTERKFAEDRLREANRELDAFVYTVSHDLRSPLTPIIGYADFLREEYAGQLDVVQQDCLNEISQNGNRMLELLEDLLSLAHVGHLELPRENVDTHRLVQEVIQRHAERLSELGSRVVLGRIPAVKVPPTLLCQLFDNLLVNAMAYGHSPGHPIEITGERHGGQVRFCVRDHGPGIPPEEREGIFELFYRGTTSRGSRGTGIGLATVQKIVRLLAGRIWVEETPGGGATFCVEFNAAD